MFVERKDGGMKKFMQEDRGSIKEEKDLEQRLQFIQRPLDFFRPLRCYQFTSRKMP